MFKGYTKFSFQCVILLVIQIKMLDLLQEDEFMIVHIFRFEFILKFIICDVEMNPLFESLECLIP